ncbi:acyl-CoA dehydrogenase family protein [bacterium AH-315-P07]|nr:acyl-CoA dehydrogenase family protein [bacterium AH-315-P07]
MATTLHHRGASYLFQNATPEEITTPEDMDEEQRMMMKSIRDFAEKDVMPVIDEVDARNIDVVRPLFKKAADLGIYMAEVPEEYGGLGLSVLGIAGMMESRSYLGSLSSTVFAHQGIGSLPLINFGTPEQVDKYLEPLMTGEMMAAFALTEPGSGSDAMNIKTTATLNEEGTHYIVSGSKQWITNAGWADLFILFAKVDGQQFTAFLMEREFGGVNVQKNEDLLGIRGSSVCAIILEDVPIPIENVLGEIGKGHLVALCTLNLGRMKMATNCVGGGKKALICAAKYAKERYSQGNPIAEFGIIQQKLADMAMRLYASQSAEKSLQIFINYEFPKKAEKLMSDYIQARRKLQRTEQLALSQIAQAKAKMASAQARYNIEQKRIENYREQIEFCVMVAERAGLVVYGGQGRNYWGDEPIKEGTTIRERQAIITIPDMTTMAVKVNIHESDIKKVQIGLRVRIRVDAFPDEKLEGEVTKVAVLPNAENRYMNPDLKVYETTVRIQGVYEWLKPGMSAETEILIKRLDDTIYIPLQSVVPRGKKLICFVIENGVPVARVIEPGDITVEYITVESGLEKGEQVLIRPPEGSRRDESEEDGEESDDAEESEEKNDDGENPATDTETKATPEGTPESTPVAKPDEKPLEKTDEKPEEKPVVTKAETNSTTEV